MTEPTLMSQLLGFATTFICFFVALMVIENNEQKRKRQVEEQEMLDKAIIEVYQQGRKQFNNIARENIRNCDRKFTFDTQAPVGLTSSIEDVPQIFRAWIEDYDRLACDYQEEASNNDFLRKQNAGLLEENGRLLYQEMTMESRRNQRKWGARA